MLRDPLPLHVEVRGQLRRSQQQRAAHVRTGGNGRAGQARESRGGVGAEKRAASDLSRRAVGASIAHRLATPLARGGRCIRARRGRRRRGRGGGSRSAARIRRGGIRRVRALRRGESHQQGVVQLGVRRRESARQGRQRRQRTRKERQQGGEASRRGSASCCCGRGRCRRATTTASVFSSPRTCVPPHHACGCRPLPVLRRVRSRQRAQARREGRRWRARRRQTRRM